ncbi:hypothetical protein PRIPAC_82042 [Pristionchus pacificus]|uniref:Serpentine receptor class gamma n=1 Tax=Pristionchus pacificus TaxID=54126 RepID=A0A2A6C336_PRIPA|nr:hypothetical protein PRIPAC_82042 [Pristionchus pacificus]|eukprot:PDM72517.1 G protein-coupled receptor [Pristionchus pacificus]
MVWYIDEIPDYILTSGYAYLLYRIRRSNDPYFSTPFYVFFVTTGIGGIVSVYTHTLAARIIYYPDTAFIYTLLFIISHIGALSSTLGKAIIIMHRYLVFSNADLVENRWSKKTCRRLICLQFVVPLLTSVPLLFFGYSYQTIDGQTAIYSLSEQGILIMKVFNGSVYAVYSVFSILLVTLTGRGLIRLSRLVEGPTRKIILEQQRSMFIVVMACSLSHLVKALHQFAWGLSSLLGPAELTNKIWPFVQARHNVNFTRQIQGPCTSYGDNFCFLSHDIMVHLFFHSILLIAISFWYR